MRIVVCIKQVPSRDAPLQVDSTQQGLQQQDTRYESNEADQYALEHALRIKDQCNTDQTDAEIIIVSLGPARINQVIKEALAKGADRAIHIDLEQPEHLDPLQQANAIAETLSDQKIDLLLSGLQSEDMGFGQTGVMIAARMKLPHASMIVELERTEATLTLTRELESGSCQNLTMTLPCALTIQSGRHKPRYANMKGIIAAKKKPLTKISYSDLNNNNIAASQQLLKIYHPEKNQQTEFLGGSDEFIATTLLDKLKLR